MSRLAKSGAIAFALWGLLHIAGGLAILFTTLTGGAGAGFAFYGHDGTPLPAATGGILGYFAYFLVLSGGTALAIAIAMNWRNSETGLALNTGLVLAVEIGLIAFLLIPGHLDLADAWPGLVLFILGATLGGVACRKEHADAGT